MVIRSSFSLCTQISLIFAVSTNTTAWPTRYRYFAYGSNMVDSVIKGLRQVEPLNATAAVLPNFKLKFNVGGGGFLDGAAASVAPSANNNVHGVLYDLTAEDFARVGSTEGIPFAYRWQRCKVYSYLGDGEDAGKQAMANENNAIDAFTLVKSFPSSNDESPPSRFYRDLLIQGAKEWELDQAFVDELESTTVARNLIVKDGLQGALFKLTQLGSSSKQM